jgi:hypothetical protein
MRANRIAFLVLTALAAGTPALPQTLDRAERQAVITRAGELLIERYVFPNRAEQAKAKIAQALAAGEYDGIADPKEFAIRLTSDLQSVTHDKHMQVFFINPSPTPPPTGASAIKTNAGFMEVDELKGNIGYIKLQGFPAIAPFKPVADQAMADLADTQALIIDMRDNGGGNPETVDYLCSFFFDPKTPVHINDLVFRNPGTDTYRREEYWTKPTPTFYRKPIYLLTSNRTFSGGEEFVFDLKIQKRAKLIGETTGGGANPGGAPPLNSRFSIFIPNGRAENPITKTNWEGTGVSPDEAVARDEALRVAMLEITHDNALETTKPIEADTFAPVHLLKFRDSPQPGAAEALRRLLEQTARGDPDFANMSDELAKAAREQLSQIQAMLNAMGEIKTVTFKYVGPGGLDVYEVACANGKLMSGIFLSPDGKVAINWLQRVPTADPAAQ